MTPEKKRKIVKGIAVLVGMAGLIVIGGWIFDVSLFKRLAPDWVSMKFDTAVAFVLSGVVLYFVAQARWGEFDAAQVVLPIASLVILLLMGTLFFSSLLGVHTGVEELFIQEVKSTAKTVIPGRPSLPTMLNFILIASAAILTVWDPQKATSMLKLTGLILVAIGAVAVAGYLGNFPLLYYFIAGANSAMACHTAILFVLLGAGFLCL